MRALVSAGHEVIYVRAGDRPEQLNEKYADICRHAALRYSLVTEVMGFILKKFFPAHQKRYAPYIKIPSLVDLWQLLFKERPDVLVIRRFFPFFVIVSLAARARGVAVILYDQKGLYSHHSSRFGLLLERVRIKPRIRYTPVVGYPEHPSMIRLKGVYIPFIAPPVEEGTSRSYVGDGRIRILMVGGLSSPRKRAEDLFEAFLELGPRYPVDLTIIGSQPAKGYGRLSDYFRRLADAGLENRVELKGGLDWPQMQEAYLSHDIFVLPSIREPASYSQLEAMAYGMPVILSDWNKSRCYVQHTVNGYWFKGKEWRELADRIEIFLREPEHIRTMGRESARLASTRYGPDLFLRRFHRLVRVAKPVGGIELEPDV